MKKVVFICILSFFAVSGMTQEWAPVGATWYYTESFFGPGIDFTRLESVKDTLVAGISCRKITKYHNPDCTDRPTVEFMYESNHRIYFYDKLFSTFQTLYDFSPVPGNSWYIKLKNYSNPPDTDTVFVTVDSIRPVNINGTMLNKFFVTYDFHNEMVPYFTYTGILIERIGDLYYMFNFSPSFGFVCDGSRSDGLRCYDDNVIGHYETGIADSCTYVSVGIPAHNGATTPFVRIYPNPVQDYLKIKSENCRPVFYTIRDMPGKTIRTGSFINNTLSVSGLLPGIYLLDLYDGQNNRIVRQKFIKE
jgi:hypothetical protein